MKGALVIAALTLAMAYYFMQKDHYAYIEKNPAAVIDHDFTDINQEELYTRCIVESNDQFKKLAKRGRVTKDNYPQLFAKAKKSCVCLASDDATMKLLKKAETTPSLRGRANQQLSQTARRCAMKFAN